MAAYHGDKTIMRKTMKEIAETQFPHPDRKKTLIGAAMTKEQEATQAIIEMEQKNVAYWEANEKAIKAYNEALTDLNSKYTSMQPFQGIIVRVKHLETKKKGDIFIPTKIPMKEMTQNGIGIRETLDSPWKFSTYAVVVSTSLGYNETFKPGEPVQLNKRCILAEKPGVTHPPHLPYGFTHYEWYDVEPPSDVTNEHFGYLLVDPMRGDVLTKILNNQ